VLGSERTEYLDEQQAESVYVHFVVVVRRTLQRQNQKTIQDSDRVDHVCVFLFSWFEQINDDDDSDDDDLIEMASFSI